MTPGLVIFDCDGVLVDSMGIDMRELTRAIGAAGGTLTAREVDDAFHGVSLPEIERGVAAHLGRPVPDGWMEGFLADRAAAFERELQPIPGAAEAVAGVRALGWDACIASSGAMQKMELTLRVTGLRGAVPDDRIFSATMVAHPKPAPDLFLYAAEVCGFAPDACVVVEDSVPGITAGRAAKMRTLGYTGGDAAAAERLAAIGAEPLADLHELPARLAG
ncbi:MAG TPA: HAD-IA family hydrolase [Conexibacter sp.]|jgi:HAD superfamily hydrolase (TIGR01509 family)|nr:HAD-IA family hydrolase [Conexibacter sp.]